ncbi:hypothetical protein J2Z50_002005 [Ensifer mexicanus]|nr:hypothetical protein [Sinorhizobium mexicanum]
MIVRETKPGGQRLAPGRAFVAVRLALLALQIAPMMSAVTKLKAAAIAMV